MGKIRLGKKFYSNKKRGFSTPFGFYQFFFFQFLDVFFNYFQSVIVSQYELRNNPFQAPMHDHFNFKPIVRNQKRFVFSDCLTELDGG